MFENKVFRKILRSQRDEFTGKWRKLHNAELYALYSSPNNIKMDLREVGCDAGDWIALVEDRNQWRPYVRTVMNLRVP